MYIFCAFSPHHAGEEEEEKEEEVTVNYTGGSSAASRGEETVKQDWLYGLQIK